MLQPHVMNKLGTVEGFADRGAAARLLPAFPKDFIGTRRIHTQPVPDATMAAWGALIRRILDTDRNTTPPRVLRLAPDALRAFNAFQIALEPTINSEGRHMADWINKYAGAVLRIAGLLHIVVHKEPESMLIDAGTIAAAVEIGHYFHANARIMFRLMFGRKGQSEAASILEVLRTVEGDTITRRALWQRVKNRADFMQEDFSDTLETLEDHGFIRREMLPARQGKAPDGRPSEIIYLSPYIQETQSQNAQNLDTEPDRGSFESYETAIPAISHLQTINCDPVDTLDPAGTDGAAAPGSWAGRREEV